MNQAQKIAIIIDSLNGGGAEKVCLTLAHAIQEKGTECHLIVLKNKLSYTPPKTLNIHFVFEDTKTKLYKKKVQSIAASRLNEIKDRFGPFDKVFVNLADCYPIVEKSSLDNCTYIVHNSIKSVLTRMRKLGPFKYYRSKRAYQALNGKNIVTVSDGLKKEVDSIPWISPKSLKTIYNPINIEEIQKLCKLAPNIELPQNYIVHIGRFAYQKRHDVLFKAFKQIDSKFSLVLLCPNSKKLQTLIKKHRLADRTIVAEFQQNPYPIISNAAALALSSDFEGFGMVIVEALACSTPVVSTDCPHGPNEILTDELNQFLSPVRDYKALAEKIHSAMLQKHLFANEQKINPFRMDTIVDQYLNL